MRWSESLAVGRPQIDCEHAQLVALVNRLYAAMQDGDASAACGRAIGELIECASAHLASEQRLAPADDDMHAPHRVEAHADFIGQLREFKQRFDAGSTTMTVAMLKLVIDWLSSHIVQPHHALVPAQQEQA